MSAINLNGKWCLAGVPPDGKKFQLEGTVPGSALHDLVIQAAEGDEDIFWRDNAQKYRKYENCDWVYTKKFNLDRNINNAVLVFEKIDTYCDIYLNGRYVGECDNAFIPHSFDLGDIPCEGENELEIYFKSPLKVSSGKKRRPCAFASYERLYTRRPQCTYGWDWTMRFVTCGIPGNVYIQVSESGIKIKDAYVYTADIDEDSASIGIDAELEEFSPGAVLDFEIYDEAQKLVRKISKYCEEAFIRLYTDIVNPSLWYPLGYGMQPLYRLKIKSNGKQLFSTRFGIRTVKIIELPDDKDSENYRKCIELKKTEFSKQYDINEEFTGFILKVNGKKIMCKGANWVPCEPFAGGSTDEKVTKLLELAADAGVNMIRVWGGGDFETEHFYDECSELGIMVTQDFLMACGQYPEDEEWFREQLGKEAEYIVHLIRNKPCLVWWSGDNENAINGNDLQKDYRGRTSAYKAIAPVIYHKDPYRRFLPSSPYGGANYASNTVGTTHNTQFLGDFFRFIEQGDLEHYKEYFKLYNARFIAEEPCLGAVSEQSLARFMTQEDIYGDDSRMWLYHTQSNPALKKEIFEYITEFAEKLMGEFTSPEDRLFKLKYLQYEWIRVSLERTRREKWFCSGIIYWMLNDCWPAAAGWALIDYYAAPKAAYYSFKRAAKPLVLSVDLEDDLYKIHLCNDSVKRSAVLRWYAVSEGGKTVFKSDCIEVLAKEGTSSIVHEVPAARVPDDCFIVVDVMHGKQILDRGFYKNGKLTITPCNGRITLLKVDDISVTIKANAYVHAVELTGDALFEDNYFSMMEGEEKVIGFKNSKSDTIGFKTYTI